ncbi:winged helix-turn-helix domain-containing protein, partial [Microcoleus sp. B3-D7]|uniref:winged helix-turn-helix domain-containing protein n=1 Tax=Microcoleus sp. B3-D7 TaxID=2818659 RepID=UPI002FD422B8
MVGYWKKQFTTKGIAEIKLGHKGSKGYLTARENTEVIEWLKNKEYCNLDELVTYLDQEFGVIYKSKQSYYELFNRAKNSLKKTQKNNPKFDKQLVKKTERINDILFKNKAGIESGEIIVLFLDECHLLHGDLTGYVLEFRLSRSKSAITLRLANNSQERQW